MSVFLKIPNTRKSEIAVVRRFEEMNRKLVEHHLESTDVYSREARKRFGRRLKTRDFLHLSTIFFKKNALRRLLHPGPESSGRRIKNFDAN